MLAVRSKTLPRGQALLAAEQRAFFGACVADRKATSVCDAALLAVLYGAGLRRSEVVALELANYDPETAAVTVRSGQGRKARVA